MGWASRWKRGALLVALLGALALPSSMAAADAIPFQVTVVRTLDEGSIDPAARRFDKILRKRVRYQGLEVVKSAQPRVAVGEVHKMGLPGGAKFAFRPLDLGPQGVLVAVEIGNAGQGDFRFPKGKPMIFGHRDLIVVLEMR